MKPKGIQANLQGNKFTHKINRQKGKSLKRTEKLKKLNQAFTMKRDSGQWLLRASPKCSNCLGTYR